MVRVEKDPEAAQGNRFGGGAKAKKGPAQELLQASLLLAWLLHYATRR